MVSGRWRGTRDQLTWHAGLARGCDTTLRPRRRAARGPREAQVARTRGRRPRGSTRTPVWGATWQGGWCVKGPQVNGPWWGYWGGNAKALPRPTFYTHKFRLFLPCGTMFPHVSSVHETWHHRGGSAAIAWRLSCGPESTESVIEHVRLIGFKWRYRWTTRGFMIGSQSSSHGHDPSWRRHIRRRHVESSQWAMEIGRLQFIGGPYTCGRDQNRGPIAARSRLI